mmetsp:Transcript_100145/g.323000  ORF Transcript_100145/g.323000 Transcript_100145/m.323000 type:complete len:592 (-) Transcript_100145:201-1976(-)
MGDNKLEAKACLEKGKSGDAMRLAMQELAGAKVSGDQVLQADALVLMAEIYIRRYQPEMALRTAKDALSLCKLIDDKKTEAAVLQSIANAFLMVTAGEQALRAATRLETVMGEAKDMEGKANASLLIAQAYLLKEWPQAALEKAEEAAKLFKETGSKRGEALASQTLAEVQLQLKVGSAALKEGSVAVELFKGLEDKAGQAAALNAVAGAQQLLGEAGEGLKAARESLLLFRQAGDRRGEAAAKATCACLRPKPELRTLEDKPPAEAPLGLTKHLVNCVPGVSGPSAIAQESWSSATRIMGSMENKSLTGTVVVVTGASRGIGKGIATILAEAGAIVYVTARSSPGKVTDSVLRGTVDETAAAFAKLGGVGIAAHMDHAQQTQNNALAELVANNHGRLDVLVNNAFYQPMPSECFYNSNIWVQPVRHVNEQMAVGGFNHVAQTLRFLPCLRRGKGLAVNVSNWSSQQNVPSLPASHFCSKAAFDRTMAALSERVRHSGVYVITLWPGSVRTERNKACAQQAFASKLRDTETSRFSGLAVRGLSCMLPTELARLAALRRTIACADVVKYDVDGYFHQGDLMTFTTGGRTLSP